MTLNSIFIAVANIAFYKLALEKNSELNSTKYRHNHTINMRRYWPKEQIDNSGGCHLLSFDMGVLTKKDDISNFWPYAREVHRKLNINLNETKRALKLLPLSVKIRQVFLASSLCETLKLPGIIDCHYSVSNMGNLDKSFASTGEVVDVTKVLRQSSGHFFPYLGQFSFHTFRGRLTVTFDYYTHKVAQETALLIMKSLQETFLDVASTSQ